MAHALIIDDDRSNLDVLAQLLELSGVRYTALLNAEEAPQLIESGKKFDIIIIDLEMPNINGYELLAFIQQQPHLSGVPVVACTVYSNEIATAHELGFHSFIAKPLDVDKFPQQLEMILSGQPVWENS